MDPDRRGLIIMVLGITSAIAIFVLLGELGYTGIIRWAVLAFGVVVPSGINGYLDEKEATPSN